MSGHLEEEELERYLDGNQSLLGKIQIERHLRGCEECRARLESVKAGRAYLDGLRGSLERLERADKDIEKSGYGQHLS